MSRREAEQTLSQMGQAGDDQFDLLEAALACAIHEDPERDPQPVRDLVDVAVRGLKALLVETDPDDALAEVMCGELHLDGDIINYDHSDNSDLIAVAHRRKGLPVALGVLYIAAGRRAGIKLAGVDFPNHFLLRVETGDGPVAVDPFSQGRLVLPSELTARAIQAGLPPGAAGQLDTLMSPVADRAVAIRLENNIYARASAAGDFARAERSALRRGLIDPKDHRPWLDVAAAREGQGALAGAMEALARAQALDGGAALAARAARERVRLKLN